MGGQGEALAPSGNGPARRHYDALADQLAAIGVRDTAVNFRNKVARGQFSAVFLVQCLAAMGSRLLRIGEDAERQQSSD